PAVEAAHARPRLSEARVVGRDRQVADDVQHMATADRIAGDHCHYRLRQAADLDLEVEHVEAACACRVDVTVVPAHALVSARAESFGACAGEDDDAYLRIVARDLEGPGHLGDRCGAKGVADLGPVDRDLGDAVGGLVEDVLVFAGPVPGRLARIFQVTTPRAITSTISIVRPLDRPSVPAPRSVRTNRAEVQSKPQIVRTNRYDGDECRRVGAA